MGRLLKAVLKLLKGKVKIHIGTPGGPGIDINFDKKPGILPLAELSEAPIDFNLWLGLWKAARAALVSSLTLFLAAGGIDNFFDVIQANIPNSNLPTYIVLLAPPVLSFLRNFIKQALNSIPK